MATTTVPRPLLWTCKDFHRVGDLGVFEGRRPKLIRGVILEEGRMSPAHAETLGLAAEAIREVFRDGWRMRHQSPLVLAPDLDPVPDLAIIAGSIGDRDAIEHPTTADLVIEVADSSLSFDTNEKAMIYATADIREYWVIDINSRRLTVFRDPFGGDYASKQTLGPADVVSPLAVPSATLNVADILV